MEDDAPPLFYLDPPLLLLCHPSCLLARKLFAKVRYNIRRSLRQSVSLSLRLVTEIPVSELHMIHLFRTVFRTEHEIKMASRLPVRFRMLPRLRPLSRQRIQLVRPSLYKIQRQVVDSFFAVNLQWLQLLVVLLFQNVPGGIVHRDSL